jgi:hypothetical protein
MQGVHQCGITAWEIPTLQNFVAAEPKPNVTLPHLFNLISQSPPGKNILSEFFFSKLLLSMGKTGIPCPHNYHLKRMLPCR